MSRWVSPNRPKNTSHESVLLISGGHPTLLGIINSFVHMIMYFYYFLTSFKPELKQSIWWKKHITQLQMIQFSVLIVHFALPLFNEDCLYPKSFNIVLLIQNLFMFALFSDFYYRAYLKAKVKKVDWEFSWFAQTIALFWNTAFFMQTFRSNIIRRQPLLMDDP